MSEGTKYYEKRDIEELDVKGNYYYRHMRALEEESLRSRSSIAAELGHRDFLIEQLSRKVKVLEARLVQIIEREEAELANTMKKVIN